VIRRAATPTLPAAQRDALAAEIRRALGLVFGSSRQQDLDAGILCAMDALEVDSTATLLGRVVARDPSTLEALAEALTIGETYFLRHPEHFHIVRERALPEAMQRRGGGRIRMWSAGCSSGEEAYSLAITALERLGAVATACVQVIATDINPKFLARARAGRYGVWSFRDVPAEVQRRWFTKDGPTWRISPEVQRLVRFEHLNMGAAGAAQLGAAWPEDLDVIFCRNVLIYFDEDARAALLDRLARSLAPGGRLILGPSDAPPLELPGLTPRRDEGVSVYQNAEGASSPPAPPLPGRPPSARPGAPPSVATWPLTPIPPPAPLPRAVTPLEQRPASTRPTSGSTPPGVAPPAFSAPALPSKAPSRGSAPPGVAPPEGRVGGEAPFSAPALPGKAPSRGSAPPGVAPPEGRVGGEAPFSALALPGVYLRRASERLEAGEVGEAVREGQRAVMLEPRAAGAHLVLGAALMQSGDVERAARSLRNARAILIGMPPETVLDAMDGVTAADALAYCGRLERALAEPAGGGNNGRRRAR